MSKAIGIDDVEDCYKVRVVGSQLYALSYLFLKQRDDDSISRNSADVLSGLGNMLERLSQDLHGVADRMEEGRFE